jgi:23S rRNA pseudouridine2605 synthase
VQIATVAEGNLVESLVSGVRCDGDLLRARKASVLRSGKKNSWIEIVLDEGKNRQIRRMLYAFDVEVLRLVRVAIGPVQLGRLAKGEYRRLSDDENLALDRALAAKQVSKRQ